MLYVVYKVLGKSFIY